MNFECQSYPGFIFHFPPLLTFGSGDTLKKKKNSPGDSTVQPGVGNNYISHIMVSVNFWARSYFRDLRIIPSEELKAQLEIWP